MILNSYLKNLLENALNFIWDVLEAEQMLENAW